MSESKVMIGGLDGTVLETGETVVAKDIEILVVCK